MAPVEERVPVCRHDGKIGPQDRTLTVTTKLPTAISAYIMEPPLVHGADFSTTPLSRSVHMSSGGAAGSTPWYRCCRGIDSMWHSPRLLLLFYFLRNAIQPTMTPATQARLGTQTARSPRYPPVMNLRHEILRWYLTV